MVQWTVALLDDLSSVRRSHYDRCVWCVRYSRRRAISYRREHLHVQHSAFHSGFVVEVWRWLPAIAHCFAPGVFDTAIMNTDAEVLVGMVNVTPVSTFVTSSCMDTSSVH